MYLNQKRDSWRWPMFGQTRGFLQEPNVTRNRGILVISFSLHHFHSLTKSGTRNPLSPFLSLSTSLLTPFFSASATIKRIWDERRQNSGELRRDPCSLSSIFHPPVPSRLCFLFRFSHYLSLSLSANVISFLFLWNWKRSYSALVSNALCFRCILEH